MFGWGTSGYDNKYPYLYSQSTGDYLSEQISISGTNYDWGVYNCISNGGNVANAWRTLTKDEWTFLFNTRYTSSGIRYAKAQVNGVNGIILLPDDWSVATYSLNNTNESDASYTCNVIGEIMWASTFENVGAVFLPAAGGRIGKEVRDVGSFATYWSSSHYRNWYAYSNNNSSANSSSIFRMEGKSVRLVCPAE